LKRLQRFDAYAKTLDDFRVKTTTGAASEWILINVKFFDFCRDCCFNILFSQ
jgi:hypothetical protein